MAVFVPLLVQRGPIPGNSPGVTSPNDIFGLTDTQRPGPTYNEVFQPFNFNVNSFDVNVISTADFPSFTSQLLQGGTNTAYRTPGQINNLTDPYFYGKLYDPLPSDPLGPSGNTVLGNGDTFDYIDYQFVQLGRDLNFTNAFITGSLYEGSIARAAADGLISALDFYHVGTNSSGNKLGIPVRGYPLADTDREQFIKAMTIGGSIPKGSTKGLPWGARREADGNVYVSTGGGDNYATAVFGLGEPTYSQSHGKQQPVLMKERTQLPSASMSPVYSSTKNLYNNTSSTYSIGYDKPKSNQSMTFSNNIPSRPQSYSSGWIKAR